MADRSYPPLPEPLPVGVFVYDNHTHIDPTVNHDLPGIEIPTPAEHLERAASVGVAGIVQVGVSLEASGWGAECAAREPRVLAAVALHPNEAPGLAARGELDDHLAGIAALASQARVRAVGETGLDFFRLEEWAERRAAEAEAEPATALLASLGGLSPAEFGRQAQKRSFEAHIDIAKEHDLALQIHDRDAHDEVVGTLLRVGAPDRTVFHCFSGDAALAELAASHGWYVSFSGTVTFKNAPALREALQVVPPSRVLIETDAPFLTPAPLRGRPNAPYMIVHTLRFMAQELERDLGAFAAQLAENTRRVYGSWEEDLPGLPGLPGSTDLPGSPDLPGLRDLPGSPDLPGLGS